MDPLILTTEQLLEVERKTPKGEFIVINTESTSTSKVGNVVYYNVMYNINGKITPIIIKFAKTPLAATIKKSSDENIRKLQLAVFGNTPVGQCAIRLQERVSTEGLEKINNSRKKKITKATSCVQTELKSGGELDIPIVRFKLPSDGNKPDIPIEKTKLTIEVTNVNKVGKNDNGKYITPLFTDEEKTLENLPNTIPRGSLLWGHIDVNTIAISTSGLNYQLVVKKLSVRPSHQITELTDIVSQEDLDEIIKENEELLKNTMVKPTIVEPPKKDILDDLDYEESEE